MISSVIKRKTYVIILAILLLGFVLRLDNLTTWPRFGATFDEFAWTWLGMSLISEQVPSSWSSHEAYVNHREYKVFNKAQFWIVRPYLEHPPFFGVVTGSFAMIQGADSFFDVTLDKIRPLAVILGLLSIIILFFLLKELYDEKIALLASLIYATVPTIVIGSRLVQNENFFIPLFLLSLFLIVKYIKNKKALYLYLTGITCGILILSKIPWAAATLAVVAILFYKNKYRDAGKIIIIATLFFILYLIYGFYFNSEIFVNLWRLQLARYDLTFNSVFALLTQPFLVDRIFIDGWIYLGWISFFILLVKDFKQNYVLIFGLLAYLGIFIFAIPNEAGHGWYRYPFYPFLATSIALFLKEYFNKNIILTFLFILLIGLSMLELSFKAQFGFSFKTFRIFLVATLITLIPLFIKNKKLTLLSYQFNNLMLVVLFGLSMWTILEYNEQ